MFRIVLLFCVWISGREIGGRGLPICGDYGVAFYIDAFGFGFLTDAVEGRFVLLFLEGARHCGLVVEWEVCGWGGGVDILFKKVRWWAHLIH